jgi:hypothetical protein
VGRHWPTNSSRNSDGIPFYLPTWNPLSCLKGFKNLSNSISMDPSLLVKMYGENKIKALS